MFIKQSQLVTQCFCKNIMTQKMVIDLRTRLNHLCWAENRYPTPCSAERLPVVFMLSLNAGQLSLRETLNSEGVAQQWNPGSRYVKHWEWHIRNLREDNYLSSPYQTSCKFLKVLNINGKSFRFIACVVFREDQSWCVWWTYNSCPLYVLKNLSGQKEDSVILFHGKCTKTFLVSKT